VSSAAVFSTILLWLLLLLCDSAEHILFTLGVTNLRAIFDMSRRAGPSRLQTERRQNGKDIIRVLGRLAWKHKQQRP